MDFRDHDVRILGERPPEAVLLRVARDARGHPIDQGLAILFPAPASYTGETVAEFHGHGSPAALRLLREQLPPPGAGISLTAKALASDSQLDALAPPEAMVVSVLRPGPKTYAELGVSLALDELSLGVAVLSLAEQGLVSFGTMHLNQRNSPRRPAAAAG